MTIIDSRPSTHVDDQPNPDRTNPAGPVLDVEREAHDIAALLPEQEWCEDCAHEEGPYGPGNPAGMPVDVVDRSLEQAVPFPEEWDEAWGNIPVYAVTFLACGHTLSRLC